MIERIRIVGIIVTNGKLLLVKGNDNFKEFWTPGGKLNEGESEVDCLKRELYEELSVQLKSSDFIGEYVSPSPYHENVITIQKIYVAKISGELNPSNEIQNYIWMTKEEYKEHKYPLIKITRDKIIPDLIEKGYF